MPDGARAKVHYHKGIETIAYLLGGFTPKSGHQLSAL
jgi:hypothetical protein